MYDQANPGILMQRKQFMILIISLVTTVSIAIIFAVYITNALVQGQVAHALEAQAQQYKQTTARLVDPAVYTADTSTSMDTPANACEAPILTAPEDSQASAPATHPTADNSNAPASQNTPIPTMPNNTYNNAYTTAEYIHNINSGNTTTYSHSFNQGSYNTVTGGSLTQTNTNNNSPTITEVDSSSNANSGQNNMLNSVTSDDPIATLAGMPVVLPSRDL